MSRATDAELIEAFRAQMRRVRYGDVDTGRAAPARQPSKSDRPAHPRGPVEGRLLALDPSSTKVGWAVFPGCVGPPEGFGLIGCRAHDPADQRIAILARQVLELVREHQPARVVIERTEGLTNHYSRGGYRAIAVLAGAQQALIYAVSHEAGVPVETVSEAVWTGHRRKQQRAQALRLICPEYEAWGSPWDRHGNTKRDPGYDVADALELGLWRLGMDLAIR
jgi:Holliday junction resolvasome RuvABC endonuclease subunit